GAARLPHRGDAGAMDRVLDVGDRVGGADLRGALFGSGMAAADPHQPLPRLYWHDQLRAVPAAQASVQRRHRDASQPTSGGRGPSAARRRVRAGRTLVDSLRKANPRSEALLRDVTIAGARGRGSGRRAGRGRREDDMKLTATAASAVRLTKTE